MNNNEIFKEFWQNYVWPEPKPVLFRVYHDEQGRIIEYSHDDHAGAYIDVDPQVFHFRDHTAKVIDGQLVPAAEPGPPRLVPSHHGTPCHPLDVTVVCSESSCVYWNMEKPVEN